MVNHFRQFTYCAYENWQELIIDISIIVTLLYDRILIAKYIVALNLPP